MWQLNSKYWQKVSKPSRVRNDIFNSFKKESFTVPFRIQVCNRDLFLLTGQRMSQKPYLVYILLLWHPLDTLDGFIHHLLTKYIDIFTFSSS